MKIKNKISLFIFLLFVVLVANNFIGLAKLASIENELKDVVNQDIVLKDVITSVNQRQLKKAIQFQRVLRIAEEMGFETMTLPRRNHLISHTKQLKERFDGLSEMVSQSVRQAQIIVEQRIAITDFSDQKEELIKIANTLRNVKQTHVRYDQAIDDIVELILEGGFKVSFEDIKEIYREEGRLNTDIQLLESLVKELARQSLVRAENNERQARRILWFIFLGTMIVVSLIGFWIMHSIGGPLKNLLLATQKISDGEFATQLKVTSKDEIGEVSHAFNIMAAKLNEFRSTIEKKNDELAKTLNTTNRQKEDLQKVNAELDDFVHTVSHDIRAPLMGVRWYAAYLQKHQLEKLDKKGVDCVEGITKGVNRLNAMIDDLLALTRIARVRNPYSKVNMNGLIRAIVERLEVTIQKLNVTVEVQPKLPSIVCDQIKLGEVFLNLISNAIKFSSKNTEAPLIQIGYIEREHYHEFYVKDNGIGIPLEHHRDVFDAFKRLHNVNEYEGTGAGLNIVKKVIEEHQGRIWVESEPGKGANFRFTIAKSLMTDMRQS